MEFSPTSSSVAVIGAGVVGLSVALRLKQTYPLLAVTIVSEGFIQNTTSYGAGGLWEPYALSGTSDEKVLRWGKLSFEHFRSLFNSPDAAVAGVQLTTCYQLFVEEEDSSPPFWKDIVVNFTTLSNQELRSMGVPAKYTKGYSFGSFIADQKYYLQYMTDILQKAGVKFQQHKVYSLDDTILEGFQTVFNCTGLGARSLVDDEHVYPIRGQVLRVKAPWMKNVWLFGSSYVIPNLDTVVLGGTAQKDNWDTFACLNDTKQIMDRIAEVFPAMSSAPIETIWAGLRPGRTSLRLEKQLLKCQPHGREVIHCYGHGGAGITLAMGCAEEAVKLLHCY